VCHLRLPVPATYPTFNPGVKSVWGPVAYADGFLTSLFCALFFSLIAHGLNLMFDVMSIGNLAHGEFIMKDSHVAVFFYAS
jgi:hypothetical protein